MKRLACFCVGLVAALAMAMPGSAEPAYLVSEAQPALPQTHSERLYNLMVSPRSDAGDRTFDLLVAIDKAEFRTDLYVRDLRKSQVYSADMNTKSELERYTEVKKALDTVRGDVEALQDSINKSIALWSKAEGAAAQNEMPDAKTFEKIDAQTAKSEAALKSLKEQTATLQSQAKSLDDPRLENLASLLSTEHQALSKVISLSSDTGNGKAMAAGKPGKTTTTPSEKTSTKKASMVSPSVPTTGVSY